MQLKRFFQLMVFFNVALYCSYAYLYFFNTGLTSIKPLYWHMFTINLALFLAITKLPRLPEFAGQLNIWLGLFLFNSIVCFLYSPQGKIEVQALIENFETIALLISFIVIFQTEGSIRIARLALLLLVLFSVSINIVDFITPLWTKLPGRAAGLYVNPTIAGKMLILAMVLSIPLVPKKVRIIYCAFVGLGVFITFSRGPWLFWVIALVGLAGTGYIEFGHKRLSILVIGLSTSFIVYSALTGSVVGIMESAGLDKYLTSGTYARLGVSGAAFSDYSSVTRAVAAEKAWSVFAENPWLGAGLGHDQNWIVGTHNTYLRMAVEGGLFRLAIFVGLIFIIWNMTDSLGRVTLIVYAVSCLTSQDNLRAPALLVILALIIVVGRQSKTTEKIVESDANYNLYANSVER